jgi:hypothetical protein
MSESDIIGHSETNQVLYLLSQPIIPMIRLTMLIVSHDEVLDTGCVVHARLVDLTKRRLSERIEPRQNKTNFRDLSYRGRQRATDVRNDSFVSDDV